MTERKCFNLSSTLTPTLKIGSDGLITSPKTSLIQWLMKCSGMKIDPMPRLYGVRLRWSRLERVRDYLRTQEMSFLDQAALRAEPYLCRALLLQQLPFHRFHGVHKDFHQLRRDSIHRMWRNGGHKLVSSKLA
jgi:hypothetical protein